MTSAPKLSSGDWMRPFAVGRTVERSAFDQYSDNVSPIPSCISIESRLRAGYDRNKLYRAGENREWRQCGAGRVAGRIAVGAAVSEPGGRLERTVDRGAGVLRWH